MPFIAPTDPYARPPRHIDVAAVVGPGDVELIDGYLRCREGLIVDRSLFEAATEIDLDRCRIEGVVFAAGMQLEATNCSFVNCDLSQTRLVRLDGAHFVGCKFVGSDFSGARIDDVHIEGGLLRYTNLRMTRISQTAFVDTTLDDVDFYEARLTDVSFAGSALVEVAVGRTVFDRVDFRRTGGLGITQLKSLKGALISDQQVIELAYPLALSYGADIERDDASWRER